MRIGLFGGTGGTGLAFLEQALAAGHTVTALIRTPSRLTLEHDALTVVQGDVLDAAAVDRVVQQQDVIVNCLGTKGLKRQSLRTDGTRVIVEVMQASQVERLVVVSSMGVGASMAQLPWFGRVVLSAILHHPIADHSLQEEVVRASKLDWTIVRPGGLQDGPKTGTFQAAVETDPSLRGGRIRRADLAAFLLQELETGRYRFQAVSVV